MCEDRVLTLTIHMVRNNSLLGEGKAAIMLQHDLTTAHIALILLLLCPIEAHYCYYCALTLLLLCQL